MALWTNGESSCQIASPPDNLGLCATDHLEKRCLSWTCVEGAKARVNSTYLFILSASPGSDFKQPEFPVACMWREVEERTLRFSQVQPNHRVPVNIRIKKAERAKGTLNTTFGPSSHNSGKSRTTSQLHGYLRELLLHLCTCKYIRCRVCG